MTNAADEKKKQVIGLYGEMQLAMELHSRGWQVHRSYIDEGIDFVITKYWCITCNKFVNQYIRNRDYKGKKVKCVTNLYSICKTNSIKILSRYLQVKTSEGVDTGDKDVRRFSFHPKIRYDMGEDVFYVWLAVFEDTVNIKNTIIHYYIFNTKEVNKFDDTQLDTYQITDSQKTELPINITGKIIKSGKKYNYSCFNGFYNNFSVLNFFTKN